jgi:hypothetical protein
MRNLVNILLRQARRNNPSNPRKWLEDLQASKWSDMSAQNGQIVGTALNGKSITIQALPGTTIYDIIQATEDAITTLDAGFNSAVTQSAAFLR